MMEDVLGSGTPVTINKQRWVLLPLDFFDIQMLANDLASAMTEEEIKAVTRGGAAHPLDLLDRYNSDHALSLYWLMLRKADPSLSDSDRDACRYKLTKADVRRLFAAGSGNEAAFASVIAATGLFPDATQVNEADTKNDAAPEKPAHSLSRSTSKKGSPSSSSESTEPSAKS